MRRFALDSNIISFYLKGNKNVRWNVDKEAQLDSEIVIPPFAYYEVKRGLEAINAKKLLRDFDAFCARVQVGKLDDSLLNYAIPIYVELQHKGRPCDDMDILIAAFPMRLQNSKKPIPCRTILSTTARDESGLERFSNEWICVGFQHRQFLSQGK
jgi:predicted nucleic acid-binding protein